MRMVHSRSDYAHHPRGSLIWFECGLVTYFNASKIEILDVKDKTLGKHGAVNKETVQEFVARLKN